MKIDIEVHEELGLIFGAEVRQKTPGNDPGATKVTKYWGFQWLQPLKAQGKGSKGKTENN